MQRTRWLGNCGSHRRSSERGGWRSCRCGVLFGPCRGLWCLGFRWHRWGRNHRSGSPEGNLERLADRDFARFETIFTAWGEILGRDVARWSRLVFSGKTGDHPRATQGASHDGDMKKPLHAVGSPFSLRQALESRPRNKQYRGYKPFVRGVLDVGKKMLAGRCEVVLFVCAGGRARLFDSTASTPILAARSNACECRTDGRNAR